MVIVDTTVWVDYLRGADTPEVRWLERELPQQRLGLTDLTLCEILQGVKGPLLAQTKRELLEFEVFHAGGIDLAIASAGNYRHLRDCGFTVRGTIDCLVATFCLAGNHQLLHHDRDFDPFEKALGLKVVHA